MDAAQSAPVFATRRGHAVNSDKVWHRYADMQAAPVNSATDLLHRFNLRDEQSERVSRSDFALTDVE